MPDITSPVPASRCPHCRFVIDTFAWQDGGHLPEVGDLTICQGCARVLRFGRHLTLTAMTDRDELAFLAANPDITRQVQIVARRLLSSLPFPGMLTS
jgi:hypothetical protein